MAQKTVTMLPDHTTTKPAKMGPVAMPMHVQPWK
jgi:hypothetical protein